MSHHTGQSHPTVYHTTLRYHTMSHHTGQNHPTLYHNILYHIPNHTMSQISIPYDTTFCYSTQHCDSPRHFSYFIPHETVLKLHRNHTLFLIRNDGYYCSGNITEWTKCTNVTKDPERTAWKISKDLKEDIEFL
jgi:hypothetical protein